METEYDFNKEKRADKFLNLVAIIWLILALTAIIISFTI